MKPQTNTSVIPGAAAAECINTNNDPPQPTHVMLHPEDFVVTTDARMFHHPNPDIIDVVKQVPSELNMNPSERQDEKKSAPLCNKEIVKNTTLKTYSLESFDRNVMIIFNHNIVEGYPRRTGTEHDVRNLKETFEKLNFRIIQHTDLNRDDLKAVLKQFSETDFTDVGCVVVVVLTHGVENGYLSAKDCVYHESELIAPFTRNPKLTKKPKIFIIQACRGPQLSEAAIVGKYIQNDISLSSEDEDLKVPLLHSMPRQPDVLLLHSTYAGFVSYRESDKGSWIIQALCKNIQKLGDKEHFEDILRAVKYEVAVDKEFESYSKVTSETELHKQMPVVISTLRRKLYFTKPSNTTNLENVTTMEAQTNRIMTKKACDDAIGCDDKITNLPRVRSHSPMLKSVIPEQSDKKLQEEHAVDGTAERFLHKTKQFPKNANTYEVETFEKNIMIIFNNYNAFGYENRDGTHEDVERLIETFAKFNFSKDNIIVHNDFNYKEIIAAMEEFSNADFTEFGCVVVVVLTHCTKDGYLMAYDRRYDERDLIHQLYEKGKKSLLRKPKVFIIQACRGARGAMGRRDMIVRDEEADTHRAAQKMYTIGSDMLLLHNTTFPENTSHRDTLKGSWFIKTLCKNVTQQSDIMDLLSIMVLVSSELHKRINEKDNERPGKLSIAQHIFFVQSTLTSPLYFIKRKQAIKSKR